MARLGAFIEMNASGIYKTDAGSKAAADLVRKVGAEHIIVGAGMFIFPHGMHVDRDGNVWVTDGRVATSEELATVPDAKGTGHTVVKFSPVIHPTT